jgi:hypothetical protein
LLDSREASSSMRQENKVSEGSNEKTLEHSELDDEIPF